MLKTLASFCNFVKRHDVGGVVFHFVCNGRVQVSDALFSSIC